MNDDEWKHTPEVKIPTSDGYTTGKEQVNTLPHARLASDSSICPLSDRDRVVFDTGFAYGELGATMRKEAQHRQKVWELVEKFTLTGNDTMAHLINKHFGE